MALDLLAVQDDITAKLRELPQDVYESAVPDDSRLRFDANGMILPYIVIEYSDMYEMPTANGILSTRFDTKMSYIIVSCIGPTERSARQVANMVRDKLTGYVPVDAGEMKLSGGGISYTKSETKLNRYMNELAFTFPVNIVW
jgi:hypothetical protein